MEICDNKSESFKSIIPNTSLYVKSWSARNRLSSTLSNCRLVNRRPILTDSGLRWTLLHLDIFWTMRTGVIVWTYYLHVYLTCLIMRNLVPKLSTITANSPSRLNSFINEVILSVGLVKVGLEEWWTVRHGQHGAAADNRTLGRSRAQGQNLWSGVRGKAPWKLFSAWTYKTCTYFANFIHN